MRVNSLIIQREERASTEARGARGLCVVGRTRDMHERLAHVQLVHDVREGVVCVYPALGCYRTPGYSRLKPKAKRESRDSSSCLRYIKGMIHTLPKLAPIPNPDRWVRLRGSPAWTAARARLTARGGAGVHRKVPIIHGQQLRLSFHLGASRRLAGGTLCETVAARTG